MRNPLATAAIVGSFLAYGTALAVLHGAFGPAVAAIATGLGWIGSGAALSKPSKPLRA